MKEQITIGTLFSGGGGFDIGAIMAGYTPLWAVEYIEDIARVYADNLGDHVIIDSLLNVDPKNLPYVDLLHASPPCPNFSNAKKGAAETENDKSLSLKICEFLQVIRPEFFTLENVYGYRKSQSFKTIVANLKALGYGWQWWHLNSADYGVPQTRRRLILIARRDGKTPQRPRPTHEKNPLPIGGLLPWVGWYEAIEDLIPTLEPSNFAPWQLEKLPDWFKWNSTVLAEAAPGGDRDINIHFKNDPSSALRTASGGRVMRAFLVRPDNASSDSRLLIDKESPSQTIPASMQSKIPTHKVFIIPGGNANSATARNGDEPAQTISDTNRTGNAPRAFVMKTQSDIKPIEGDKPMETLRSKNAPRISGFIPHNNANSGTDGREGADPVYTLAPAKMPDNTAISGKVVKLSIRALARLQSFPDWYKFPDKKTTCTTIIGNSVPPLLAYAIVDSLDK